MIEILIYVKRCAWTIRGFEYEEEEESNMNNVAKPVLFISNVHFSASL